MKRKGILFWAVMTLMLILSIMSTATDLTQFSNYEELNIPLWHFYIIFSVDALIFASLVGFYFYKKWAVFTLPLGILTHFLIHTYYLSTMLYTDLNLLFVFTGGGLLVAIPEWEKYKS